MLVNWSVFDFRCYGHVENVRYAETDVTTES